MIVLSTEICQKPGGAIRLYSEPS